MRRLVLYKFVYPAEDDWEASHFAEVGGEGSGFPSEALHNDDAILKAMPIAKVNHAPYAEPHAEEEVSINYSR